MTILKKCYTVDISRGVWTAFAHILAESCHESEYACPLRGLQCPVKRMCSQVKASDWKKHIHEIFVKSLGESV